MTEADLLDAICELAGWRGWLAAHFRPARTDAGWRTPVQGDAGFPDLVLAGKGRLIFAELKSASGRLSADQADWMTALGAVTRTTSLVWRPHHWTTGAIDDALR